MNAPDFEAYLREYEVQGIGESLYSLILGIVRQTVRHYPPDVYSPNQVWDDDAIVALCHDFTIDKLLEAGCLEHHLLAQETTVELRRVLVRDFRHFLINHRKQSVYLNLFSRVRRILRNDSRFRVCYPHQKSVATIWGLSGWEDKEIAQEVNEVVEAMFTVDLPPLIRYRADSKKLSHLLSNKDLGYLLEETFKALGKCIGLQLFMEGIRYRLNLLEVETVSLNELIGKQNQIGGLTYVDVIPDSANPAREVSATMYAEDIYERLTDRQRYVLAVHLSQPDSTLEQIGDQVGVSKSTVHNDLAAVAEYVDANDVTQKEAEKLLSHLSKLCVRYLEEQGKTI